MTLTPRARALAVFGGVLAIVVVATLWAEIGMPPRARARGASATPVRVAALVALGALLAAAIAARLYTRAEAARIRRLEEFASRMGGGESGPPSAVRPAEALDDLGLAIQRMAGHLGSRLEALQRERDERELILAHMSDGVALVDDQGRIAQTNHRLAVMLDASRPAAPGTPFQEFVRAPELGEILEAARREGRTVERELRLWTPRAPHVRATATPLGGLAPGAVLLVLHDLTEAERLQRMRQDFVANVSHELRTPLTSLRGYAETLLEGGLDDPEHRESFVRVMRDQAVRLQALLEDLLSLAELERPDATLRIEDFDLRDVIERQLATFRAPAEGSGLALSLAAGGPEPVRADRVRLEQAVANLLDNAVKYTESGRIDVTLGGDRRRAWIEVRDTGPGIPAVDLPRIFERFYRVDKARSRERGGTGLGLSIVKHVASLHEGLVSVESVVGRGSAFRIEIPRRVEESAPEVASG